MNRSMLIFLLVVLLSLSGVYQSSFQTPVTTQPNSAPLVPFADSFANSGQSLGDETGNGVALGDLDGDGDQDAFVANDFGLDGANQIWWNDGTGIFSAGAELGDANGYAVAVGDLDGDSDLDGVVAGAALSGAGLAPGIFGPVQVWVNQGGAQGGAEGGFAPGATFSTFTSYGVALGDLDGDSDLDALVVGNSNQVWLNDGSAAFTAGPALPFLFSKSAALADLDGDGWLDAVIADSGSGAANRVYWNDGNWTPGPGSFTPGDPLPTGSLVNAVAVGNLDADSLNDIFLASSGQDQIYWNDGARSFSTAGPLPVNDSSWGLALSDVNGDMLQDAVVANISAAPNRVWLNQGTRVFTVTQEFGDETGLYWSRGIGLIDLNGDGPPDLFETTTAEDRVWFNLSAPPIIPNAEGWQIQTLDERGDTGKYLSQALDASGYPHIAYVSQVAADYDEQNDQYSYNYILHYAHWDGVRWHTEIVVTGDLIRDTTLLLDGNGAPHITYLAANRLAHLVWNGAVWQSLWTPVFSDYSYAFALDSNDRPHFAYLSDFPELDLLYSYYDGAAWQTETIASLGEAAEISLALDAGGSPHISYLDLIADGLYYAHKTGGAWTFEVVDNTVSSFFAFASLALDDAGSPHLAYSANGAGEPTGLTYAKRIGGVWQIQIADTPPLGADFERVSLDLDSQGYPHMFAILQDDYNDTGTFFRYTAWNGASWQVETVDRSSSIDYNALSEVSIKLDGDDRPHASYYEPVFGDLRYLSWAPNWQIRPLPETGTNQRPDMGIAGSMPHIGYYNVTGGQLKLAVWDDAWDLDPVEFVTNPVTDLSAGTGSNENISFYDADNQRLLYGYRDLTGWHLEVVDETGDVGGYNDLALTGSANNTVRIAYWDATSLRIKLAVPRSDSLLWDIYPNNSGPPLNAGSGSLSMSVLPAGDIGVAYYDGANGDLRLAVWNKQSAAWSDDLVDGAAADVGSFSSLQTDGSSGEPVVAYLGQGALRFAYRLGGLWHSQDVPGTDGESITSLSLELGLNSRRHARIAYTTSAGAVRIVALRDGVWHTEEVATSASTLAEASLARDRHLHLAYTLAGSLQYAFRTATIDVDSSAPGLPPPAFFGDGYYNPLDACLAVLDLFDGDTHQHGQALQPAQAPLQHLGDDHAVFRAMTVVFNTTPGGQHYVNLYRQFGSEMGQIGLGDAGLLWDAYGVLQNFIPGIEALVTGHGDTVIVTQQMVDGALSIWQRLAAAGSPELAAAINAELAQHNNLQDFAGLTFDEWARAIGVAPPPRIIYLPLVPDG